MEKDKAINREIRDLSVKIALNRFEYAEAVAKRLPVAFREKIADELCEQERQKKCLETGNFKALPYNINMLYNAEKM